MTDNITLPRAVALEIREALMVATTPIPADRHTVKAALTALDAALAEPHAICSAQDEEASLERIVARAVEAAVKECVTICERQRVKILKNPADPSWTEHLAEVQSEMKQRFGVEMGYLALAEPPATREPATDKQVHKWYWDNNLWGLRYAEFHYGWQAAERFHGIGGSK